MKLAKRLVFLLVLGIFWFEGTVLVQAATSCNFTHVMETTSRVKFVLKNCTVDGSYVVLVERAGDPNWSKGVAMDVLSGEGGGVFVASEVDSYTATLIFASDPIGSIRFSIVGATPIPPSSGSSPTPIGAPTATPYIPALRCGDPCNANDMSCPASCPCTMAENGANWTCEGTTGGSSSQKIFCDSDEKPIAASDLSNLSNLRVYTALGCIPIEVNGFVTWLLPNMFGIAGGIAFLLMIFGFIKMSTAKGDPKEVQGARETISSALMGLLVSIFALFILRLVAVDILHIPGIN